MKIQRIKSSKVNHETFLYGKVLNNLEQVTLDKVFTVKQASTKRSLKIYEDRYGPENLELANTISNLGLVIHHKVFIEKQSLY